MLRTSLSRRLTPAALAAALLVPLGARAQTLSSNLTYTAIQPCRLVDTRIAGGALVPGTSRAFNAVGVDTAGSLASQGGDPNGCPIPGFDTISSTARVQAIAVNLVAVGSTGPGNLVVWPTDRTRPATASLNYASSSALSGLNLGNGAIVAVRQDVKGNDFTVLAQVSGTHLVVDVVGYWSNGNPMGLQNVALGPGASNPGVSTANYNTAVGEIALGSDTSGGVNTAIGWGALSFNTTGKNNTGLGVEALIDNQAGSNNVAIGHYAGWHLSAGDNNLYLSNEGGPSTESDTIRIGHVNAETYNPSAHTATYIAGINGATVASGVPVLIDTNGHLGTTTSSLRFKEDVADMGEASSGLLQLRPVTFRYKAGYDDGSRLLQYGLIAEEVAQVYPGLVQLDREGQPAAIRYQLLDSMLLNEVQKEHRTIAGQKAQIESQAARLAAQEAEIRALAERLARLEAEKK